MEQEISDFNGKLEETKNNRLSLLIGSNFLELHILSLNQELNILKQCEDHEELLVNKVNDNLQSYLQMEDILDSLKNDKEELEFSIENYHAEESKIQDHFKHATETNKFYDFLKKVFKKKYKPPKQPKADGNCSVSVIYADNYSLDIFAFIVCTSSSFIHPL